MRDALCIFKEKYRLRRLKDFQFNNDIQNIMNGFLSNKPYLNELSEKEVYNTESIIDNIDKTLDYMYNNDDLPYLK